MKKILFAMAALAALASCQKAEIAEQNFVNTNGERVITAYFDNAQTKTTLGDNGVTPKWASGDKIMLLDGSGKQEITLAAGDISSDGKSVTFTTTLTGTLYAVYPSTATDAVKIETENIVPVTLKAEQDGTFGSANICVAKDNDGSLAFKNVTSVLHLTQEDDTNVNEIILTTGSATAYIAGTGTVDMSTDGQPALTLSPNQSNKIKVKSASVKSDYYIAVAPTTLPAGTAFGFATGSKLGGTNLSGAKTIVANTIYDIGSMDEDKISPNTYHDYVEINGLKWATMNLGATTVTEYGKLYSWGNLAGQSGDSFNPSFNAANYTDTEGGGISSATDWDKTKHDAAYNELGGSWRMPTKQDFTALANACKDGGYSSGNFSPTGTKESFADVTDKGVYWLTNYESGDNKTGLVFCDGTNKLFFPAAGFSNTSSRFDGDGYYWSSTWASSSNAYELNFSSSNVKPQYSFDLNRYFGQSVRAISE